MMPPTSQSSPVVGVPRLEIDQPSSGALLPAIIELGARRQWVVWRFEVRPGGKSAKPPYDPRTGSLASVTDVTTWASYAEASAATPSFEGLGFVVMPEDPFTGIDLDGCRVAETGTIAPWAQSIVDWLASYTEVTPSGTGLRVWVRGSLPPGGRVRRGLGDGGRGAIELYDRDRYFTLTGDHVLDTPTTIEDRQVELAALHADLFAVPSSNGGPLTAGRAPGAALTDEEMIERASKAANGATFRALWAGEWQAEGYPSQSEADLALLNILGFWVGPDAERLDRFFRRSRLMRPKWDEPRGAQTYGARTIAKALGTGNGQPDGDAVEPESTGGQSTGGGGPITPSQPEEARGTPGPTLRLISFETIVRDPVAPIDWAVEGLIPRGDRVVLYGEWGSLKSWLLLDLAIHLASGRPWLGKFAVPAPRRVLYIDEEMGERTLRRRIKRLAAGAGLEDYTLPLRVLSRPGLRFTEPKGAERLLDNLAASGFDPEVIIVESFRRVLVGDEKDAKDVAAFWRAVEPIVRAGKTLIISHHMRKPNPNPRSNDSTRDRASGSTDILAGADSAFSVIRWGRTPIVTVQGEKSRETEEAAPIVIRLDGEGDDGPTVLRLEESPIGTTTLERGALDRAKRIVLRVLADAPDGKSTRAAILAAGEASAVAQRTIERALSELTTKGRVGSVTRGVWQLVGGPDAP